MTNIKIIPKNQTEAENLLIIKTHFGEMTYSKAIKKAIAEVADRIKENRSEFIKSLHINSKEILNK